MFCNSISGNCRFWILAVTLLLKIYLFPQFVSFSTIIGFRVSNGRNIKYRYKLLEAAQLKQQKYLQFIRWHITINCLIQEKLEILSYCPRRKWRRREGELKKKKILTGFHHKLGGMFPFYRPIGLYCVLQSPDLNW